MKVRPLSSRYRSARRPLGVVIASAAVVAATATLTPLALADPAPSSAKPGAGAPVAGAPVSTAVRAAADDKYIVGLAAAPVAMYDGGIAGLARTRSVDGAALDRGTDAVAEYRSYLDDQRSAVLDAVPGVTPFYEYDWAFAGFAAQMSYDEALAVAAMPGVRLVAPNEIQQLDTTRTPTFLGLDQPGGAWETAGGADVLGGAGEDVVIGILDTGFSPEAGSFQPLDPAPGTTVPDGWLGTCDPGDPDDLGGGPLGGNEEGDQPAAIECDGSVHNNKVVGAHYFVEGFGTPAPQEFLSPRGLGGHGSHTGSTAGGNYGVPVTVAGADLGEISGMAPRARLAMYKVCWEAAAGGGCASADTTAAIDQATADGVDVINYSISGSLNSAIDPQALSFMGAAAAGVFVAASAGNSGASATVAHNYPWVTTVAASTVDRRFDVTATLGSGKEYHGTGISTGVPMSPLVWAGDIPADGSSPTEASFCPIGSLDPKKAEGTIVLCLRGNNIARVDKSEAVRKAGGIGMILWNDGMSGASTNTERHSVPTAHVSYADGAEIMEYVDKDSDPTASLSAYDLMVGDEVTAPDMASFSSRGPGGVADGNLLKPDITAPGVDIIAAVAPYPTHYGELYGFMSGTSMSSPHIAGLGALMRDIHPDWSPMAIKSALMTGAYQTNNQGDPIQLQGDVVQDATPFEYGAGHVNPQSAAATPLVYESGADNWMQFLCGTELPTDELCDDVGGPISPSDLNLPSIAVSNLAGVRDVPRTVTNRSDATVTATASFESPEGFTTVITPDEITLAPGASATFVVRIEQTTAPLDEWRFGAYTWTTTDAREMRSPVAVKADSFDATKFFRGEGSSGEITDITRAGVTADVEVHALGLDEAQVDSALLSEPTGGGFPTTPPDPADLPPHIMAAIVDMPNGTAMAQFELYGEDYAPGTDLDLYVYKGEYPDVVRVGASAGGTSDEKVVLENPEKGPYLVYIDLWALAPDIDSETVYLHSYLVGKDGEGDFTATPDSFSVEPGSETPVTFSWQGLKGPEELGLDVPSPDVRRYLGVADYVDVDAPTDPPLAQTLFRIDVGPDEPSPSPTETETPTETPTGTPTETPPPTTDPTPTATTTLPGTGGGDAGLFAALGLGAIVLGGAFVALAARRLREGT